MSLNQLFWTVRSIPSSVCTLVLSANWTARCVVSNLESPLRGWPPTHILVPKRSIHCRELPEVDLQEKVNLKITFFSRGSFTTFQSSISCLIFFQNRLNGKLFSLEGCGKPATWFNLGWASAEIPHPNLPRRMPRQQCSVVSILRLKKAAKLIPGVGKVCLKAGKTINISDTKWI